MSLSEELNGEDINRHHTRGSQIEVFLATLPEQDRADFDAWLAAGAKNKCAMHRVLKRRGLSVANSTFRNWVLGL